MSFSARNLSLLEYVRYNFHLVASQHDHSWRTLAQYERTLERAVTRFGTPLRECDVAAVADYYKEYFMARNKYGDMEIVGSRLTAEQTREFKAWQKANKPDTLQGMKDIVAMGYKLTIVWVDSTNAHAFSVVGNKHHLINPNKTISSWARDWDDGIGLCLWKIYVLYEEGEWTGQPDEPLFG